MEIKITSRQILQFLLILSWMLFVGIALEAGAFLTNAILTYFNPNVAKLTWQQVDLSALNQYDTGHYLVVMFFICLVAVMKAIMFYLIIRILQDNKFNLAQPFTPAFGRFIFTVSYLVLGMGLASNCGVNYADWLVSRGVSMPNSEQLHLDGGDVWIFMSIVLFVIAQIFKRGIEIQSENELTI